MGNGEGKAKGDEWSTRGRSGLIEFGGANFEL